MVSKRLSVGGFVTLMAFLYLLMGQGAKVDVSGDSFCLGSYEYPCHAYFNITPKNGTITVRQKAGFSFDFNGTLQDYWFERYDTRKKTWKEFNPANYTYRNNTKTQARIVAIKKNPADEIKWGMKIFSVEKDPVWFGINASYIYPCEQQNETYLVNMYNESVACNPANLSCTHPVIYQRANYSTRVINVCSAEPNGFRVANRQFNFYKVDGTYYCGFRFNEPYIDGLCLNCNCGDCQALKEGRIRTRAQAKGMEGCVFRYNAQTKQWITFDCEGRGSCSKVD